MLALLHAPTSLEITLRDTVIKGIKQVATCRYATGSCATRLGRGRVDVPLAEHIRTHVEVFATDGAADEQLAGSMLTTGSGRGISSQAEAVCPLLRKKPMQTIAFVLCNARGQQIPSSTR